MWKLLAKCAIYVVGCFVALAFSSLFDNIIAGVIVGWGCAMVAHDLAERL